MVGVLAHGVDRHTWGASLLIAIISLIISAAALVGVTVSLIYQSRQTKISREENMRVYHRELLSMAINDPVLRVCWGGDVANLPEEKARQVMFSNMIVNWWQSAYIVKDSTDEQLALLLDTFFRGEIGREYWALTAESWRRLSKAADSKRKNRFVSIVDERYRAAMAQRT
ncbi:DUF6082 family protein [Streptomyces sp. NPDC050597]|uniref:DUF6082 family protein n=1 Tax=Streptomyces sp. NPDC050597 TaxID=3157212 RepID=UPI0034282AE5